MNIAAIKAIAEQLENIKSIRINVAPGERRDHGYIPSEIKVGKIKKDHTYYQDFVHLHAPIFERHGRQMQAEFAVVIAQEVAKLEAELKGEICPQPEPDPDAYLAPLVETFGPHHLGLNATWVCMAWCVVGANNMRDGVYILDDESPEETVSLVTRKDDGSSDPVIVTICQGSVAQVLPIAKAIAVQVQHG